MIPLDERRTTTNRGALAALIALVALAAFVMTSFAAQGANPNSVATISVDFHNNDKGFNTTSSKDLSNIIIEYCDGSYYKIEFDDDGKTYSHYDSQLIVGVWIKSGSYQDPNGPPGAGQRFDNNGVNCDGPVELRCEPTDLALSASNAGNALNWTATAGADSYNVYRSVGVGPFVWIANVAAPATMHLDSSVTQGTLYRYAVTAMDGEVESQPCGFMEIVAVPVFPSLLAATGAMVIGIGAYAAMRRRQ